MSVYGNNIESYNNYLLENVLLEAYIGKTPILKEIEGKIAELKENAKYNSDISKSSTVLEINRLFEKQFGMNTFALSITHSKVVNACTMPINTFFDICENYDVSKWVTGTMADGYKFKPNNPFCIVVYVNWGIIEPLEPDEVIAVILHEIGHNFADCLYDRIKFSNSEMIKQYHKYLERKIKIDILLTILTFGLRAPSLIRDKKELDSINNNKEKKKAKRKANNLKGFFEAIKEKNNYKRSVRSEIMARKYGDKYVKMYKARISSHQYSHANGIPKENEVFADKFAAVYGYGVETAKLQAKLAFVYNKSQEVKDLEEANEKFRKASEEYDDALRDFDMYDAHPQVIQRINECLNTLKNEYNKMDVDPKVKAILKNQIDEIESIVEGITKGESTICKVSDKDKIYNAYINDEYPNAVDDDIEKNIEHAFDKLLDEDKERQKKQKEIANK